MSLINHNNDTDILWYLTLPRKLVVSRTKNKTNVNNIPKYTNQSTSALTPPNNLCACTIVANFRAKHFDVEKWSDAMNGLEMICSTHNMNNNVCPSGSMPLMLVQCPMPCQIHNLTLNSRSNAMGLLWSNTQFDPNKCSLDTLVKHTV